jgi:hypothetical protein
MDRELQSVAFAEKTGVTERSGDLLSVGMVCVGPGEPRRKSVGLVTWAVVGHERAGFTSK